MNTFTIPGYNPANGLLVHRTLSAETERDAAGMMVELGFTLPDDYVPAEVESADDRIYGKPSRGAKRRTPEQMQQDADIAAGYEAIGAEEDLAKGYRLTFAQFVHGIMAADEATPGADG